MERWQEQLISSFNEFSGKIQAAVEQHNGVDPESMAKARIKQATLMHDRVVVELDGSRAAHDALRELSVDADELNALTVEHKRLETQLNTLGKIIEGSAKALEQADPDHSHGR